MKIEIFDEYRDIDRLDNILLDIWDYNSKLITPNNIDKIVSLCKDAINTKEEFSITGDFYCSEALFYILRENNINITKIILDIDGVFLIFKTNNNTYGIPEYLKGDINDI